tara:strand:+ start:2248 stop:2487 length:240 start_codon:yes stop_codon:yes gene_type:complete
MKPLVFLYLLLLTGIVLLLTYYLNKCPPSKVEYRYITPTFKEKMDSAIFANSKQFELMFDEQGPWVKKNEKYRDNVPRP